MGITDITRKLPIFCLMMIFSGLRALFSCFDGYADLIRSTFYMYLLPHWRYHCSAARVFFNSFRCMINEFVCGNGRTGWEKDFE
jgi:hypothetical protein